MIAPLSNIRTVAQSLLDLNPSNQSSKPSKQLNRTSSRIATLIKKRPIDSPSKNTKSLTEKDFPSVEHFHWTSDSAYIEELIRLRNIEELAWSGVAYLFWQKFDVIITNQACKLAYQKYCPKSDQIALRGKPDHFHDYKRLITGEASEAADTFRPRKK